MTKNLDTAIASWGAELPQWIRMLASECDCSSQRAVAAQLRYSPGTVNQVLQRKYPAHLSAVEAAFNGAFLNRQVACPVLGQIQQQVCMEHQRQPFALGNPSRVRLYRACRGGCPHSRLGAIGAKDHP